MSNLISLSDLIKNAKKSGIDFGKGDPYNRLRYYTKIGWLPHMIRQQNIKGNLEGHYPAWALNTLIKIENLKLQNMSNDEIDKLIKTKNNVTNIVHSLNTQDNKRKLTNILLIGFLLLVIAVETNVINISKPKEINTDTLSPNTDIVLIKSGTAFVPKNTKQIDVTTTNVNSTYKINITFKTNYFPATRYWVSNIKDNKSFKLELDAPASEDAEFSWFIIK